LQKKELKNIFDFIKENTSEKTAKRVVSEIVNEAIILNNQLKIGQKEELLLNRIQEFRYLVFKKYKLIYRINSEKNQVEIMDVFDCRQNPIKIRRALK
jgi:plasmid stabilization system protein ParE